MSYIHTFDVFTMLYILRLTAWRLLVQCLPAKQMRKGEASATWTHQAKETTRQDSCVGGANTRKRMPVLVIVIYGRNVEARRDSVCSGPSPNESQAYTIALSLSLSLSFLYHIDVHRNLPVHRNTHAHIYSYRLSLSNETFNTHTRMGTHGKRRYRERTIQGNRG